MRAEPLVKQITGLLYPTEEIDLLEWSRGILTESYGPIQRESARYPFSYTDYYADIAPQLTRVFFSFAGLKGVCGLPDWKLTAVGCELASGVNGRRRVNIDPGYIDGARLALASTKDNAQRVYLCKGIYAEITLCRKKQGWQSFSYTFPDFASGLYDSFLELVRGDWRNEIRAQKGSLQGGF